MSHCRQEPGAPSLVSLWRGSRQNPGTGALADPFAINPIRRSAALVIVCSVTVFGPWLFGPRLAETVMLSVGWLAMIGLVMGIPILVWSLAEEGIRLIKRRVQPGTEQLPLSARIVHILQRHGFDSIQAVDRAPDAELLLLSNMDSRGLRETRRAIAIWKYERWQEQGFPVTGR